MMRQNRGEKVTMGMQAVWDHIRLAAERTPDNIALVDDRSDRQLTFAELVEDVEAAAAGLGAAGLRPGQKVATMLPNVLEHVIAILALHRLGTVVCMINPRLKPEEAGMLIADAGMAGAVCVADPAIIAAARDALPIDAPVLTVGGVANGTAAFETCHANGYELPPWSSPTRKVWPSCFIRPVPPACPRA